MNQTGSASPGAAAAGGSGRRLDSLRAAQFVPGLVVLDWLLSQGHGLQVRRVDVLQTEQTASVGAKSSSTGANWLGAGPTLTYSK